MGMTSGFGASLRLWSLALVAVVFTFLSSAGLASADDREAYKLGTGDKLRVTVYNETDLSGDFDVNDQGSIILPLIGQVDAAGKTVAEFQDQITLKFGATYLVNPRVSVAVLNYRPFFILGEVKNPASYPYVNGMTIVNAIALAGGYTPRANKDKIVIRRASDPTGKEQQIEEDGAVLPGDVIRVPERFF